MWGGLQRREDEYHNYENINQAPQPDRYFSSACWVGSTAQIKKEEEIGDAFVERESKSESNSFSNNYKSFSLFYFSIIVLNSIVFCKTEVCDPIDYWRNSRERIGGKYPGFARTAELLDNNPAK